MSKSPDSMSKLYDQLAPAERVTLVLQAMARGDRKEAERLSRSCPRRTYTGVDGAFVERQAMSFDAMAGACVDLCHASGKLFI